MSKAIYHTFKDGPQMVAPYSHAVECGDWLFLTGQLPFLPDGTVAEGIEAQTEAIYTNLRAVMERCGFGNASIVSARVFLTKFESHYDRMNEAYRSLFPAESLPARTCVGVTALASGCDIEIDFVVKR